MKGNSILVFLWIFLAGGGMPLVGSAFSAQQDSLKLDELIREAVEKNPSILAAHGKWESARGRIAFQKAFPDPQLSYTYFFENVETRVGPQRHIFGVKQKFPFYGKRSLKAEVAAKESEVLGATYEAVKQEVISQVKKTFYQLFYLSKIIDITRREKELLRRLESVALTKYETGKGNQQNVIKIQVEITKLEERLLALKSFKNSTEEMLNKLLDRPEDGALGKPVQPELENFEFKKEDLLQMAKDNRPELKAGVASIDKSQKVLQLAEKDYFPDLTVGANYIQIDDGPLPVSDNGQDAYNVMFSVNVPIWREKLSSQAESATQTLIAQKSQYRDTLNQTIFDVEDNYFKIKTAAETFSLYEKELIPLAEQSLKSAEAGYVTGKINFLDMLDAERTLLKIQYGYWKVYTDYLKYFADLERFIGIELPESRSVNEQLVSPIGEEG